MSLTVATFNIRNTTDRYSERQPLLVKAFKELSADVVALQEVVFDGPPHNQGRFLADESGTAWCCHEARASESIRVAGTDEHFRIDGNCILCRSDLLNSGEHSTLHLNPIRVAQRIVLQLEDSSRVWVVNTHLHHEQDPAGDSERLAQVQSILEWCSAAAEQEHCIAHTVLLGDFNSGVGSPAQLEVLQRGFRSTFFEAHGAEPEHTFPTGLQAPFMDDSDPMTTDYIFHRGSKLELRSARIASNPHESDSSLYASDHMAIVAVFSQRSQPQS